MPGARGVKRSFIPLLLAFLAASPASAANISVPNLQLMTWGRMEGGAFGLNSRSYLELLIEGGYKFGGRIELKLDDADLEGLRGLPDSYDRSSVEEVLERHLLFKSVSVEMREILPGPFNLQYFTGETDVLASGDEFVKSFGTAPFASHVRGYSYFPTGTVYDGLHTINGTGIKFYAPKLGENLQLAWYLYQDTVLGKGSFSTDFRSLLNFDDLKIETFLGSSFPVSSYGLYRGGILFFYSTGLGGEFLTQIGVPRWNPAEAAALTIDMFYFLFEPRIRFDLFAIILTVFWHPEYYKNAKTNELGTIDFNANFAFGDLRKTTTLGGIEGNVNLSSGAGRQMNVRASPYISINTSGIIWDFKINFNVFPYALEHLFEAFVGMKTEF